jgi:hypothetical protein
MQQESSPVATGFPCKVAVKSSYALVSFTTGFSRVFMIALGGKPSKPFRYIASLFVTWLKPGVTESRKYS